MPALDRIRTRDRRVGRRAGRPWSLGRWVGLCAAAEAVGMTAAAGAAKAAQTLVDGTAGAPEASAALSLIVAGGLVEGVALGTAQAAGLGAWLPDLDRRRWAGVTIVLAGLGWAAASAPSVLAGDSDGGQPPMALVLLGAGALGGVMGAALGGAQAWVLRGVVPRPWRWVEASVWGWMAAMPVIFLGAATPGEGWAVIGVVGMGTATGAAAGAVLGLVTGWCLPSTVGRRRGWRSLRSPR